MISGLTSGTMDGEVVVGGCEAEVGQ